MKKQFLEKQVKSGLIHLEFIAKVVQEDMDYPNMADMVDQVVV